MPIPIRRCVVISGATLSQPTFHKRCLHVALISIQLMMLLLLLVVALEGEEIPSFRSSRAHVVRSEQLRLGGGGQSYRAAVVDYSPVTSHVYYPKLNQQDANKVLNANLDEYERIVSQQSELDIIVFPEYGLFGPGLTNRTRLTMFFEQVPNESVSDVCSSSNEYLILKRASCIAKKYHTYLVINMGDVQYCDPSIDSQCPSDKRYLYNTNVVFDRNGNLITKYHKTHLYFEDGINPGNGKAVHFTTDFGMKFGLIICFDIIFEKPLKNLIFDEKVDGIVFTSWWVNFPPYWNGLQFQQSVSKTYNTTILGASSGFGFYTSGSGIHIKGKSVGTYNPSRKGASQPVVSNPPKNLIRRETKGFFTMVSEDNSNITTILPFIPVRGQSYNLPNVRAGPISCNFKFTISEMSEISATDENNYFALVATYGKVFKPKFEQSSCTLMKCGSKLNCFYFINWQLEITQSEVILDDFSMTMTTLDKPQIEDTFSMFVGDGGNLYIDNLSNGTMLKSNSGMGVNSYKEPIYVSSSNVKNKFLASTLLSLKRKSNF